MIALAFGTVAEFQLRVVSVRAAADLALVAVASLRLRLLLLPDGGLELNGLSGPLTALDPQNALDILPEEDHKVQNCHHSGQSTGVGTVPHGPSDVPRHQSDVRPCQPLGLQRDHPIKPDLRVGIHHCEGQEHRQVDVIGVGQAPAVIPRGQRDKKAGHCHGIARVRNPSYSHELDFIKKQIGISAIINPEMAAAKEISHLLRFPGASKIDTFADGRVRLIKFALPDALDGVAIREIPTRLKSDILVCAVEREGGVIIPNGNFVLQKGDQVTFLATQEKAHAFFQQLHLPVQPVRNALIVGGGAIAYYLSQELLENHVRVRIVERDAARCVELAEQLPGAQILNEDGSNREFLLSEGLESTEAFVALTNIDEENVLLTLFAKKHSNGKLVTKVNRLEFDDILAGLDLGSVVYPKYMTCDYIVQYVRALQNEAGNNIKTLYRILDDRVEALEFTVHEESAATGVPLSQLHLKKNLLLCCITRGSKILIPRGGDQIQVGDNVIVVTLEHGLHDLRDIVEH